MLPTRSVSIARNGISSGSLSVQKIPQPPSLGIPSATRRHANGHSPPLREMNQGHGSFCHGYPMEGQSAEPIEHFRPKTLPEFYSEAFTWSNLYYCCERCQLEKLNQWDDALIRPGAEDYTFLRYFEFDYTTGAIKPTTIEASSRDDQHTAAITIQIYGLDSPQRRRRRLEALNNFSEGRGIDSTSDRDYVES